MKKNPRIEKSLVNCEKAFLYFKAAASVDIDNFLEKAGLVKCFEMSFEQFWKTFQLLANERGLSCAGPRESLERAFELGWIEDDSLWVLALKDRNQSSHAYAKELAEEISHRALEQYLPVFEKTLEKLKSVSFS